MPDRVVRDELLTSERYWSVSIEAQRLYVHLLLVVDDTARFSGKNYTIRAACFPGHAMDPAKLDKLLGELIDVDLVRRYVCGEEPFIFIPRFRQRLRYHHSRYPEPPIEINDMQSEKTDLSLTKDGLRSVSSRTQVGDSEVKRSEVKRREEKKTKGASFAPPPWIDPKTWDDYLAMRKQKRAPATDRAKAAVVAKLEAMRNEGQDPNAVLLQSIVSSWTNVYPIRETARANNGPGAEW